MKNFDVSPLAVFLFGVALYMFGFVLGGGQGFISAGFILASLIFLVVGAVTGIASLFKKKKISKEQQEFNKTKNRKLVIIFLIVIVALIVPVGLYAVGQNSAQEIANNNIINTTSSTWGSAEKDGLTGQCINNVSKQNTEQSYGYTQSQVVGYCTCNTETVAQQYPNPSEFYKLSNFNKIYDDISYSCADKTL